MRSPTKKRSAGVEAAQGAAHILSGTPVLPFVELLSAQQGNTRYRRLAGSHCLQSSSMPPPVPASWRGPTTAGHWPAHDCITLKDATPITGLKAGTLPRENFLGEASVLLVSPNKVLVNKLWRCKTGPPPGPYVRP